MHIKLPYEKLIFGMQLGMQLARIEMFWDSVFEDAKAAFEPTKKQILILLKPDNFSPDYTNYQLFSQSILLFYSNYDSEKYYSILIGISYMRAILIGASSDNESNKELRELAFSSLRTIPSHILSSKTELLNFFIENKDVSFSEILENLEEILMESKEKKWIYGMESKTRVFIVHGHDNESKQEVARFLESLGLAVVILHEQPDKGKTIIEKLEEYTDVEFAIILYTPCDEGKSKNETIYRNRARQNVVFEHGYLVSKLGRKNVCALVKNDTEQPGDLSGVIYKKMDLDGAWKFEIAKAIKAAGFNINLNNLIENSIF